MEGWEVSFPFGTRENSIFFFYCIHSYIEQHNDMISLYHVLSILKGDALSFL